MENLRTIFVENQTTELTQREHETQFRIICETAFYICTYMCIMPTRGIMYKVQTNP